MQVGQDAPAAVVGLVVPLVVGLEGVEGLENLVVGLPYFIFNQFMLYATLMGYAICPLLIYLVSNLMNHLMFTLEFTFLSFMLQLL